MLRAAGRVRPSGHTLTRFPIATASVWPAKSPASAAIAPGPVATCASGGEDSPPTTTPPAGAALATAGCSPGASSAHGPPGGGPTPSTCAIPVGQFGGGPGEEPGARADPSSSDSVLTRTAWPPTLTRPRRPVPSTVRTAPGGVIGAYSC